MSAPQLLQANRIEMSDKLISSSPPPPIPASIPRSGSAFRSGAAVCLAFLVGVPALDALPADVTVRWDYTESGAAGFALYCGWLPGSYDTRTDVGDTDTFAFAVAEDFTCFCAVTAYDSEGMESGLSNEVSITIPPSAHDAGVASPDLPSPLCAPPAPLSTNPPGYVEQTATGVQVRLTRRFDPGFLNLYGSESGGEGPADVTLVGEVSGPVRGSLIPNEGGHGFVFVKTGGVLPPDTYTLTIASRGNSLVDELNRALDGDSDGVAGGDYSFTFVVMPADAHIVSIGEFARAPGQPVNLPAGDLAAGIPIRVSSGEGLTSLAFVLRYDPTLLTVHDVTLASGIAGQISLNLESAHAGRIEVAVEGLYGLSGNPVVLRIHASVPETAGYASKHVLDIGELSVNAGEAYALDDDGVHIVALPGDVTGGGTYNSLDLQRMQRYFSGLDTGFSAFQLADPAIIGDANSNGMFSSLDQTSLLREISGVDQASIPPVPDTLLPIVRGGPDPYVSLPGALRGKPGDIVTVTIDLDTAPRLESAQLRLHYDAQSFEIVALRKGDLTGDFQWITRQDKPGVLGLDMVVMTAKASSGGSLAEVDLRVKPDAQPGPQPIDLQWAQLNDGWLTLNPAPQVGLDPTDSSVLIELPLQALPGDGPRAATPNERVAFPQVEQ